MSAGLSEAYMKMFPQEAQKKVSAGKKNLTLDIPEFNKAWNIYRDTSLDIMKRHEYMAQCIGFTDKDTEAIRESKELIAPHLEAILDHIYWDKLVNDPWLSRWFRDETGKISKALGLYTSLSVQSACRCAEGRPGKAAQDDYRLDEDVLADYRRISHRLLRRMGVVERR
jgi:hypothetical protein